MASEPVCGTPTAAVVEPTCPSCASPMGTGESVITEPIETGPIYQGEAFYSPEPGMVGGSFGVPSPEIGNIPYDVPSPPSPR